MDLVPVVREPAQLWEPFFVHRGTVPAAVRCLSRRRRLRRPQAGGSHRHRPPSLQTPSGGAHLDAMCGETRAAATTQNVKRKDPERAAGSTSLPVRLSASNLFEFQFVQETPARCLALCRMGTGLVS